VDRARPCCSSAAGPSPLAGRSAAAFPWGPGARDRAACCLGAVAIFIYPAPRISVRRIPFTAWLAGRDRPSSPVDRVQVIQERAGLQLEQAVGAVLYGTDDAREGIAAFAAKRKPRFGGH
jgi:hypothetical protein